LTQQASFTASNDQVILHLRNDFRQLSLSEARDLAKQLNIAVAQARSNWEKKVPDLIKKLQEEIREKQAELDALKCDSSLDKNYLGIGRIPLNHMI
jgi:SMC interacting uncharacterized protein involved in chromosome segregation